MTLGIYAGHAASEDGACTVQSAFARAQDMIRRVDEKSGERPRLPPEPEF